MHGTLKSGELQEVCIKLGQAPWNVSKEVCTVHGIWFDMEGSEAQQLFFFF